MTRETGRWRRKLARDVLSAIVDDRDYAGAMPVQEDGYRAIMVVDSREQARGLFTRMERISLPLTIVVRTRDELRTVHIREVATEGHAHEGNPDVWAVGPTTTMGMILDALRQMDGSLLLHLEEPKDAPVDYEISGV